MAGTAQTVKFVLFRVTAVALGILIAGGLAEGAVRVLWPQRTGPSQLTYDPRVGSIPIPNQHGRVTLPGVYSYTFTHDADGRRVTPGAPASSARPVVLLLGDSFTYGVGVSDGETFASRLQSLLDGAHASMRVINAGNPGKGTDYALRYMQTLGATAAPAAVLLCFFPNDFRDNERSRLYHVAADGAVSVRTGLGAVYARKARFTQFGIYDWVVSWSHLANVFRNAAIQYLRQSQRQDQDGQEAAVFYPDSSAGYATARGAFVTGVFLQHLARAAEATRSILGIVYCPAADEVDHYRNRTEVSRDEEQLRRVLPAGVRFSSLTPVLAASPAPLAALYYDEARVGRPTGHWTPLAHEIVAAHLARFLHDFAGIGWPAGGRGRPLSFSHRREGGGGPRPTAVVARLNRA